MKSATINYFNLIYFHQFDNLLILVKNINQSTFLVLFVEFYCLVFVHYYKSILHLGRYKFYCYQLTEQGIYLLLHDVF
jgi:hypothetical protein